MVTPNSTKTESVFTEAPVSWNIRYLTPEGCDCQLTLRGDSGQEVLEKTQAAIAYLLHNGCTPISYGKGNGNGNGHAHSTPNQTDNNNGHDSSWCPIHECAMKRWDKNGRVWFSHKTDEGWCSGKAKG